MKVKNKKGTSGNKCYCGTWFKHWENYSGKKANYCSVSSCMSKAEVGAHVIIVNSFDNSTYIVPFCDVHNKSDSDMEIGDTTLVSANVSITCGKKQ